MSKGYAYTHYLTESKILTINKSSYHDLSSFYLKILLNYI